MLSACQSIIPATTPPQLSHTPGAPLSVAGNHVDAGWFMLDYPDSWRIVTNIAIEPLRLTLVSPDDTMIIVVENAIIDCLSLLTTPEPRSHYRHECIPNSTGEPRTLSLTGETSSEFQATFDPIFDRLVASINFRYMN